MGTANCEVSTRVGRPRSSHPNSTNVKGSKRTSLPWARLEVQLVDSELDMFAIVITKYSDDDYGRTIRPDVPLGDLQG